MLGRLFKGAPSFEKIKKSVLEYQQFKEQIERDIGRPLVDPEKLSKIIKDTGKDFSITISSDGKQVNVDEYFKQREEQFKKSLEKFIEQLKEEERKNSQNNG